jgi:hypothetical protein
VVSQLNSKKEAVQTEVRLIVEVDGNPVGVLNIDIDRLWPLINHRKRDTVPVEWIDAPKFESVMRAAIIKRLLTSLQGQLYQSLGNEMVKAELDVESFNLKVETARQAFGETKADIEKLVAETNQSEADFHVFFWEYLLGDREVTDLKKEWKAKSTPPR